MTTGLIEKTMARLGHPPKKKAAFLSQISSYPLIWPMGWEVTPERDRLPAKDRITNYLVAKDYTLKELKSLGASNILISSNLPLQADGEPFLDYLERAIDEPGIAVYFFVGDKPYVMACDAWQYPKDNLRSIGVAIGHIRSTERIVAPYYLERLLAGFLIVEEEQPSTSHDNAHPDISQPHHWPQSPNPQKWWEILNLSPSAGVSEIESAYRSLARANHPDRGGDANKMHLLNQAVAHARQGLKKYPNK